MKKLIKLTENNLKKNVKNSVKRCIKEESLRKGFHINESRIKKIVAESLNRVINEESFDDDDDLKDYHVFTPNRSKYYKDDTADNFMGGIDDTNDDYDDLGNYKYDDGEELWNIGDELGDNDVTKYNNALDKQRRSNMDLDKYYHNNYGTDYKRDEFGRTYRTNRPLPSSDYEKAFDKKYNLKNDSHYSFEHDDYDDKEPEDWESGWNEDEFSK